LRLLGDVSAREGSTGLKEAEALYGEALARANGLEMRPLAALCHLSLGVVLRERSGSNQADVHLGRAAQMLQQMDMRFWLRLASVQPSAECGRRAGKRYLARGRIPGRANAPLRDPEGRGDHGYRGVRRSGLALGSSPGG
jgi:hypothetical protein